MENKKSASTYRNQLPLVGLVLDMGDEELELLPLPFLPVSEFLAARSTLFHLDLQVGELGSLLGIPVPQVVHRHPQLLGELLPGSFLLLSHPVPSTLDVVQVLVTGDEVNQLVLLLLRQVD